MMPLLTWSLFLLNTKPCRIQFLLTQAVVNRPLLSSYTASLTDIHNMGWPHFLTFSWQTIWIRTSCCLAGSTGECPCEHDKEWVTFRCWNQWLLLSSNKGQWEITICITSWLTQWVPFGVHMHCRMQQTLQGVMVSPNEQWKYAGTE